jgi:hypothetical protein
MSNSLGFDSMSQTERHNIYKILTRASNIKLYPNHSHGYRFVSSVWFTMRLHLRHYSVARDNTAMDSRVEVGSNTSTVSLRVVQGDETRTQRLGA